MNNKKYKHKYSLFMVRSVTRFCREVILTFPFRIQNRRMITDQHKLIYLSSTKGKHNTSTIDT